MPTWRSRRRPSPDVSRRPPRSNVSVRRDMYTRLTTARDGAGRVSAQLALENLAGGVAGKLLDEHDLAGHLVAGEMATHVFLELDLGQHGAGVQADHGAQALSAPLVGDAHDRHLADAGHPSQEVLDLSREDVLATRDDHVVVTAVHE